ncbi:hypothetical protein VCHENC02_1866A, partial [Vibrio harveyi]
MSLESKL